MADPFALLRSDPEVTEVETWIRRERVVQLRVRKAPQGQYEWGITRAGTTQYLPIAGGFSTPEEAFDDGIRETARPDFWAR